MIFMKKAANIKRLTVILLIFILLICSLSVLQSCGESSDTGTTTAEASDTSEVTSSSETTPEDTTIPTEPPTTTEKPPIKTEEILKWTFSDDNKVFGNPSQSTDLRVEDGIFKITSTGGDPFVYTINNNLGINAADVNYIKFKIKNNAEGYSNQLFFITTDDGGWSEEKSIRGEYWYSEGEDWEILEYETSDCDVWEGTIKQIRFDYLTEEGDVEIEYVSFEKIVTE